LTFKPTPPPRSDTESIIGAADNGQSSARESYPSGEIELNNVSRRRTGSLDGNQEPEPTLGGDDGMEIRSIPQ
jgi:hypothetical protein